MIHEQLRVDATLRENRGEKYFDLGNGRALFQTTHRILIQDDESRIKQLLEKRELPRKEDIAWLAMIGDLTERDILLVVNLDAVRRQFPKPGDKPFGLDLALFEHTQFFLIGASLDDRLKLHAIWQTDDATSSEKAMTALSDWMKTGKEMLERRQRPSDLIQGIVFDRAELIADELLTNIKTVRTEHRVEVKSECKLGVEQCRRLLSVPSQLDSPDNRIHATGMHLAELYRAMVKYHKANGHFPPPVLYGPDGKTPYSWRVALLPFLDCDDLYQKYNRSEPWDSAQNKRLLMLAPDCLRRPAAEPDSIATSYFVFVGEETAFGNPRGTSVEAIADGLEKTLLIVEADYDVPWTKPDDISLNPNQRLPKLGGIHPKHFWSAFADGRVRGFPLDFDPDKIRATINIADGK